MSFIEVVCRLRTPVQVSEGIGFETLLILEEWTCVKLGELSHNRKRESQRDVIGCGESRSRLHRDDGKRYIVRAAENLTGFVELESVIRFTRCGRTMADTNRVPIRSARIISSTQDSCESIRSQMATFVVSAGKKTESSDLKSV